jgi:hypothetical protein
MHANNGLRGEDLEHCKLFRRQLSNRALRKKSESELKDFVAWVARNPGSIGGENYGAMGQGFWSDVIGERDDEDDEEVEGDGGENDEDENEDDFVEEE